MRHRILFHIVWTTQLRKPLIDLEGARFLCNTLRTLAREHRSVILELGLVATHVHVLLRAEPLCDLTKMVGRMKGVTSRIAKQKEIAPLAWADGYNVESVSPADEQKLRHYLRAQPFRHPDEAIGGWEGDTYALDETV